MINREDLANAMSDQNVWVVLCAPAETSYATDKRRERLRKR